MNKMHYRRLVPMVLLSFVSMYVLVYAMVNAFTNVYVNLNQFYMAGLMTAPMVVIELVLMGAMYDDKKTDSEMAGSAYRAIEVIGLGIIVPCSLAALLSGLVQSLGTAWRLFRYYWIVAKLSATVVATGVLLMHVPAVTGMAQLAVTTSLSTGDFRPLRIQLVVHAVGGLLVLLTATTLSVYKPWGRIGSTRVRAAGEMAAR